MPCVGLSQGAFARVVRARCPTKECEVAVKIISLERVNTSMQDIQVRARGPPLLGTAMPRRSSAPLAAALWSAAVVQRSFQTHVSALRSDAFLL